MKNRKRDNKIVHSIHDLFTFIFRKIMLRLMENLHNFNSLIVHYFICTLIIYYD